ncbi:MAG: RDD family protein, partial [Bacteroidota bacterium]
MRSITIRTTQNVAIEYELAGSMSRVFAFLIDTLIVSVGYFIFLAIFVQIFSGDPDWPWQVLSFFLPLTIFLFYYFFCELLMQGQTIGKRVQNLQVVRADGRDPTPGDHLLRTLFLLPDAWFSAGVPALLLINTTPIGQRLGDMVANTVV